MAIKASLHKNTFLFMKMRTTAVNTAIFISLLVCFQFTKQPSFPVQDPFHHGEFLAAAITILEGTTFDGEPYTIHGAADFFPALVVNILNPSREMLLANTLILYPFLSMLTVLFTTLAAVRLARRFGTDLLMLVPFILASGLCIGWRDLLFGLSLLLFAGLVPDSRRSDGRYMAQILFGLVIAFSIYWSFNRGVTGIVAFGLPTLWLSMKDPRFFVSIATAIISFIAIGTLLPGISIGGYFDNFTTLLETSSQWAYPTSAQTTFWTLLVLASVAASGILTLVRVRQRTLSDDNITLLVPILIASGLFAKIGLGRIDESHVIMGAWLPLLALSLMLPTPSVEAPTRFTVGLICLASVFFGVVVVDTRPALPFMAIFLALALCFPETRAHRYVLQAMIALCISIPVLFVGKTADNMYKGRYDWLVLHITNLPDAKSAVTPGLLWSSEMIVESGANCVFDLSNTGLINAVANLPACSQFTYPVYAGLQNEGKLITDLTRADPPVIVYRSDFWSYAIDGRNMAERFPALDAEIIKLYPREVCKYDYCLRFQR
jgi:MFS family permease